MYVFECQELCNPRSSIVDTGPVRPTLSHGTMCYPLITHKTPKRYRTAALPSGHYAVYRICAWKSGWWVFNFIIIETAIVPTLHTHIGKCIVCPQTTHPPLPVCVHWACMRARTQRRSERLIFPSQFMCHFKDVFLQ